MGDMRPALGESLATLPMPSSRLSQPKPPAPLPMPSSRLSQLKPPAEFGSVSAACAGSSGMTNRLCWSPAAASSAATLGASWSGLHAVEQPKSGRMSALSNKWQKSPSCWGCSCADRDSVLASSPGCCSLHASVELTPSAGVLGLLRHEAFAHAATAVGATRVSETTSLTAAPLWDASASMVVAGDAAS